MADPRTINIGGSRAATQQFELAPGLLQYVQSVYVEIDNSAGAAARPTLTLSEQSGVVIAKKRQGESIPAAGSGSATWALRLADEGGAGIQFEKDPQSGGWLYVETTGTNPSTGNAFDLVATGVINIQTTNGYFVSASHAQEAVDGDWQIQAAQGGSGGTLELDSNDEVRISALGQVTVDGDSLTLSADGSFGANLDSQGPFDIHSRNGLSQWSMDDGLTVLSSGSITFQVPAGQVVEVFGALGLPVFKIDANGDLHGKTGKALVFDL